VQLLGQGIVTAFKRTLATLPALFWMQMRIEQNRQENRRVEKRREEKRREEKRREEKRREEKREVLTPLFAAYLGSSSAHVSHFPNIIKTRGQQLLIKTGKIELDSSYPISR
jgi:Flp pilus assembly protein TadB